MKDAVSRHLKRTRKPDNGRDAQLTELMGMVDSAIDIIMEGEMTLNQALNLLGEIQETTENTLPDVLGDFQQIFENRLKSLLYRYTIKETPAEPTAEETLQEETTDQEPSRKEPLEK